MSTKPNKELETFANPFSNRDYEISMECPEFSCVCPVTGQPDFATIYIDYVPDQLCLELKSIKLYLWSYRDEGAFHEKVTNQILEDMVTACCPRKMTIKGDFKVRGGIYTSVTVHYPDDHVITSPSKASATPSLEVGHRPWGQYEVLVDASDHKVKRISVLPNKRLSLQRHQKRMEYWTMVSGQARFTLDDTQKDLKPGDVVHIPLGAVHRIENIGTELLVFVEVQRGTYFGEDDIERIEDDFGRS